MSDFGELSVDGQVVTPGDPGWDEARQAWNLVADQRPEAVALVESADDVGAVVRFAGEHGLRVAGQGTGHGAAALGPLENTILVKTERMRGVEVDAGAQTARVEAGVHAIEVGEAAHRHGLSFLPGSSPNVGVTGYTLGGGMGWLGRRYGFACNNVDAIEVVTADGEQRRVDSENDDDLFWALRGGGGGYAIVTALHLSLVPVSEVYAGSMLFPAEVGAEAVRAYRDWEETIPDEVTSIVRFLTPPPVPDVPEELREVPLLTIGAACIGDRESGERIIEPLREIGEPIMDMFDQIPAPGLYRIHMDPEPPVPALGHHGIVNELSDEVIDAWVGQVGLGSLAPLLLSEIRPMGGALSRPAENPGALPKLDGYLLFGIGMPMAPEMAEAIDGKLDELLETMQPWAAEGGYYNFAERACDADAILPPETCDRLGEIKQRWDPGGMIVANHAVSLAAA